MTSDTIRGKKGNMASGSIGTNIRHGIISDKMQYDII